jgi:hypothetical protein
MASGNGCAVSADLLKGDRQGRIWGHGGEHLYRDGIVMDKTSNTQSCDPQTPDVQIVRTSNDTCAIALGEKLKNVGDFRLDRE